MTITGNTDKIINNRALRRIKVDGVNSLSTPTTDKEATCADLYPLARDALFSAHAWNFCTVERTLAADNDKTPAGNFDYAYRLPSALIAGPFAVMDSGGYPITDWINSEDYVHTDSLTCKIWCRVLTPEENWPAWFVDLFVHDLAMQYASAIKQDQDLADMLRIVTYGPALMNGQGGKFGAAKTLDAQMRLPQSIFRNGDPLTATRY